VDNFIPLLSLSSLFKSKIQWLREMAWSVIADLFSPVTMDLYVVVKMTYFFVFFFFLFFFLEM